MKTPSSPPERLLFAEPFLAWRAWRLVRSDDGPRLESCIYSYVWEPRQLVRAECLRSQSFMPAAPVEPHEAPDEGCKCGIYGSTDVDHLRGYVQETRKNHPHAPPAAVPSESRVFGLVALWGTVIECSQGYRAGKAYPRTIYLPCRMHEHADGLEAAYGVPVERVDEEHGFQALLRVVREVRAQEAGDGR